MNMGKLAKVGILLEVFTSLFSAFAEPIIVSQVSMSHEAEAKAHLRGNSPTVFLETNSSVKDLEDLESNSSVNTLEDGIKTDLAFLEGFPSSNSTASRALEDQVTDLFKLTSLRSSMSKEAFDATPFGSSVKKILDLIEKVMMPKVLEAHAANQNELIKLSKDVEKCGETKNGQVKQADKKKTMYLKFNPLHKTCRAGEEGEYNEKTSCWEEEADKKKIMDLKCAAFAMVRRQTGDQTANKAIMQKGGSESAQSYVTRVTSTVCGNCAGKGCNVLGHPIAAKPGAEKPKKCGYEPYTCGCGFKCKFDKARDACEEATNAYKKQLNKCKVSDKQYRGKRAECDSLQNQMDDSSCKRAVEMKDACEAYAECYFDKKNAYISLEKMVKQEEKDRQAEWRGLKRMKCLIVSFSNGKVTSKEIAGCKNKAHRTDHLVIKYPKLPTLVKCSVPKLYPSTPEYKKANFAPLPALAKGREDAYECTGLAEINTMPARGSPKTCKCRRITMNGPYSPGPVALCVNCLDIRRSQDKGSCPDGTKLFSPRTRTDWKTFLASAKPVRAPHWIVDVTRPQTGCGGCTKHPMNSKSNSQRSWTTTDGSPWWLRSTKYSNPSGDYQANCFMNLVGTPKDEDSVTFNDKGCSFHAKSYYCQLKQLDLKPKHGSPRGCVCKSVALTGRYSAGSLIRCAGCLRVSRSMQKNSCPVGTKIFSPRTPSDWRTFIASATPLRSPDWIIDVTQPQNGCGGCTRNAMNSRNPAQATWRTTDGTPWFLRNTKYSQPDGDYHANCYMGLGTTANENTVTFNDKKCSHNSNAYYCQPAKVKRKPPPPSPPPPPPPPPVAKAGGKYSGYMCAKEGQYTGVSSTCGHFVGISYKDCDDKCKRSVSAQDTKSCDKSTGVPNCVAFAYKTTQKICMLYRSCTKLVKTRGVVSKLKKTYHPTAKTYKLLKNRRCNGKPYTQPDGEQKGLKGVTIQQCWKACFANKWTGHKNVPLKKCVAMAYYSNGGGYCDLYDKCDKTAGVGGIITYKKLQKFEAPLLKKEKKVPGLATGEAE